MRRVIGLLAAAIVGTVHAGTQAKLDPTYADKVAAYEFTKLADGTVYLNASKAAKIILGQEPI